MHIIVTILVQFVVLQSLFGQTDIQGIVFNENKNKLTGATVVLLHELDSTLIGFDITDQEGKFGISGIKSGTYLLQITYVGYGTFSQHIKLANNQEVYPTEIWLSRDNELLKEVVVKAEHIPISIHNDTILYNSAAFKVKPNSPVEDLMRRLPGIEIDRDGTIRAQGEQVNTILVDGKEFFGSNPQIATKNLPADAVDVVQVFDKKSEMSEFSGIDDGQQNKTINLKLKTDKKKGVFGQVEAGAGTDQLFQGKMNMNSFNSNKQLSIITNGNNINQPGFDIKDYINFMGGVRNLMTRGGQIKLGENDIGASSLFGTDQGVTKTMAGGLNFNYNFSGKTELQSSYFINNTKNTIRSIANQNYIDSQTRVNAKNTVNQIGLNTGQRLNLKLKDKRDSTQLWSVQLESILSDGSIDHSGSSSNRLLTLQPLSNSVQSQFSTQFRYDLGSTIKYYKRLNRSGRLWSAQIGLNTLKDDLESSYMSSNQIFDELGVPRTLADINQIQARQDDHRSYDVSLSYTEPLGTLLFGQISVLRENSQTKRKKQFIDVLESGQQHLNSEFSDDFRLDNVRDRVDVKLIRNRDKSRFYMELAGQWTKVLGFNANIHSSESYFHVLPSIRWQYDLSSSNSIEIRYHTEIQIPSINEYQPIIDNLDPLNIYRGNPYLKPSYMHEINSRLTVLDRFSFTHLFITLSAGYINDNLVFAQSIDDRFRRTTKPINLSSAWKARANLNFSTPLRSIKSKINFNWSGQYKNESVMINNSTFVVNRYRFKPKVSIENRKKKKVDWQMGVMLDWSINGFSDSDIPSQSYLQWKYYVQNTIYLWDDCALEADLSMNRYSNESFGDAQQYLQWNAAFSKSFLTSDRLTLELSINDILGQNRGIKRQADLNFTEEILYNALDRYGMLTIKYNLSKLSKNNTGVSVQVHGKEH